MTTEEPPADSAPVWLLGSRYETQPCEACGAPVHFERCEAKASEAPDFVRALFPEQCWLGWAWSSETPNALTLLALCSRGCLVQWFEDVEGPGA